MKNLSYYLVVLFFMISVACENDDVSTPDPNLYLGTWQLVRSTIDNEGIVMNECNENSKLILYWFSESDPTSNAQLYDYELDENGECTISENVNDASWAPALIFDASGNSTPSVDLKFLSKENDTVRLELARNKELLILSGQLTMNGKLVTIQREYRKLRQQI